MSLLRTAARAAVATRVVGSVSRRQQQQFAAQDAALAAQQAQAAQAAAAAVPTAPAPPAAAPAAPAAAAAPAPADMDQVIAQLHQLGQLRDAGVLSEAEFAAQKQRLLGS